MKKQKLVKFITIICIAIVAVLGLRNTSVQAVDSKPLTDVIITKVETNDETKDMTLLQLKDGVNVEEYFSDAKGLPGVSFTHYKVSPAQLVKMKGNPTAYDTVAEVKAYVGEGLATKETNASGEITISGLEEGNYWIVENTKETVASSKAVPFALTLPFTNLEGNGYLETIHVYPKNTLTDLPTIDKTVDNSKKSNVAIGDLNTWEISMSVPSGIQEYKVFGFVDEIDSRLDFEGVNKISVTTSGGDLIKGTDYSTAFNNELGQKGTYGSLKGKSLTGTLQVQFTDLGRKKLAEYNSENVTVSFKTKVNNTAIMGQNIYNTVALDFDNSHGYITNPENPITPPEEPYVYTGGKAFVKKDANSNATLGKAEFIVKNNANEFINIGENGVVTLVSKEEATKFESQDSGKFEVKGLPYGEYVLIEIKAPKEYALPTKPETNFIVSATSYYKNPTSIKTPTNLSDNSQFVDNRKMTIPQTGGIGTLLFTLVGALLIIFSIIFYKKTSKA